MTREQIEKEIDARLEEPDNEWDGIFNSGYSRGFRDGAQWRINSVWHDAKTETPRNNEPIIGITGKIWCYMGLCGETAKEICPEMKKWAYISDLIPERKEETK